MTDQEKKLSKAVSAWVADVYRSNTGEAPKQVLGTDGKAPSKDNSFLYDPLLDRFDGKLVLNSGETLGFSVYTGKEGRIFQAFRV